MQRAATVDDSCSIGLEVKSRDSLRPIAVLPFYPIHMEGLRIRSVLSVHLGRISPRCAKFPLESADEQIFAIRN